MRRSAFVFLSLMPFLFVDASSAYSREKVSDHLVQNLSCAQAHDSQAILKSIRPGSWDAYYHLPVQNWSFDIPYELGACWSLARAQRLFFYLARWNQHDSATGFLRTQKVLDLLRGHQPYEFSDRNDIRDFPLRKYEVFLSKENRLDLQGAFWNELRVGYTQQFSSEQKLNRYLKKEIEIYQTYRFHDFQKNLRYIVGDGTRIPEKNRATSSRLIANLSQNRLTLLLLRPARVSQHVVLAKSYIRLPNGNIEVRVYDSNNPGQDQIINFNTRESLFYAPDIVRHLPKVEDPQRALGVYIVDEDDRERLEAALTEHYGKLCR